MSRFLNWKNSVFLLLTFLVHLNVVYGQTCPSCPSSKTYNSNDPDVHPNNNQGARWSPTGVPGVTDIALFNRKGNFTWDPINEVNISGIVLSDSANLVLDRGNNANFEAFDIVGGCIVINSGSTLEIKFISKLENVSICIEPGGKLIYDARRTDRNDYTFNGVTITLQPGAQIEFGDAEIFIGPGGVTINGYEGDGCDDMNGNIISTNPISNDDLCRLFGIAGLPVEYLYIEAAYKLQRTVDISWATAKEWDNSHFEIYRSVNNVNNWQKIGSVQGQGYSDSVVEYAFEDNNLPFAGGNVFYRLKQVDLSGTFEFSKVVSAKVPQLSEFKGVWKVYPNPTNGYDFKFELIDQTKYKDEPIQVRLSGPIATQAVFTSKDLSVLTAELQQVLQQSKKGVYILQVTWGQNIEHIKILKQ